MTNNFVLRKIKDLKELITYSFAKNNMKSFHVVTEFKSLIPFLTSNQSINLMIDNP